MWAEVKEQLTWEALSRVEVNLVRNPQHRLKEIKFVGQIVSKLGGTLSYVILGVTEGCVCIHMVLQVGEPQNNSLGMFRISRLLIRMLVIWASSVSAFHLTSTGVV